MKKSFLLYLDQYPSIKKLTDSQAGALLKAFFEFHLDNNPEIDDPVVDMAFSFISESFKRDNDKYLKICEKNKNNARTRWDKKNATACDRIQNDAKNADSDSDKIVIEIYSDEIKNFTTTYQEYVLKEFPKTAPKITKSLIANCCDTVDKLIRIDNFSFADIRNALKWATKDDFWCDQILSLAQLRKKAKNGNKKFINIFTAYQKKTVSNTEQVPQSDLISYKYDEQGRIIYDD